MDILPTNVLPGVIDQARNRKPSETGGLALALNMKIDATVVLTLSVNIDDQLINGQIGKVYNVVLDRNQSVAKIYVKFRDSLAGLAIMSKDLHAGIWCCSNNLCSI